MYKKIVNKSLSSLLLLTVPFSIISISNPTTVNGMNFPIKDKTERSMYSYLEDETDNITSAINTSIEEQTGFMFHGLNEDVWVTKEIQTAVEKYAKEYNLSEGLLYAIIFTESRFNPNAVSSANCKGLMQIADWFQEDRMKKLGITDVFDVDQNIQMY